MRICEAWLTIEARELHTVRHVTASAAVAPAFARPAAARIFRSVGLAHRPAEVSFSGVRAIRYNLASEERAPDPRCHRYRAQRKPRYEPPAATP